MQGLLPQIKPGLLQNARVDSTPYNLQITKRMSAHYSSSDVKHKLHSTRNAAISVGERIDAQSKSLTARYNSQSILPTSRNQSELQKLGKMRPEKKLDYIKDYLGTLKKNDPGMFDFFLTEAKSRGMLHSENQDTASLPTAATRNMKGSPSQTSGVVYGNEIIKNNRIQMIRQQASLQYNNPIKIQDQKKPSANYIFNQHLSKLLTDNEKQEFNFQDMDREENFIPTEKRSKSVLHGAKANSKIQVTRQIPTKAAGKDIETSSRRKSRHNQLPTIGNASAILDDSRAHSQQNSDQESCKMTRNASQDSENLIKISNQAEAANRRQKNSVLLDQKQKHGLQSRISLPVKANFVRRISKLSVPDNVTETRPVSRVTRESEGTQLHYKSTQDNSSVVKRASKRQTINQGIVYKLKRTDQALQSKFMDMCNEKKLKRARLTRAKLKVYLTDKYTGEIAEKIARWCSSMFNKNQKRDADFDMFCDYFDNMLANEKHRLFELAFSIYDYNNNKMLCELDVVSFIKQWENFEMLEQIFMKDLNLIIKTLTDKTKLKGCENRDAEVQLATVYKRAGLQEEYPVGDLTNPHQPPVYDDVPDEIDERSENSFKPKTLGKSESQQSLGESTSRPMTTNRSLKRTTTGVTVSSMHSHGNSIHDSDYMSQDGITNDSQDRSRSRSKHAKKSKKKYPPIEKDAWVKAFGAGYVLTLRKKRTYIEELNFSEFRRIFKLYPEVTVAIMKDITDVDLSIKEVYGGVILENEEQLRKEDREQKKLTDFVQYYKLSQEDLNKIFRSFHELCKNKKETCRHQTMYYMTAQSYLDNFKIVFGSDNIIFKDRFHDVMTRGNKKKMNFYQYMKALHPFLYGTEVEQADFIFRLYDVSNDGTLEGDDIVALLQAVPPSSIIYDELQKLQTYYVNSKLRAIAKNPYYVFDTKAFMQIIQRSCLIQEIKLRLMSKPGKLWTFSVFNSRDTEYDLLEYKTKKELYANLKPQRKKNVRFKGLESIDVEEEEKKLSQKPKLAKDAPIGVENEWKTDEADVEQSEEEVATQTKKSAKGDQQEQQKKQQTTKLSLKQQSQQSTETYTTPIVTPKKQVDKYEGLKITDKIALLKQTTKDKIINSHQASSAKKSLHLEHQIRDYSESQQSIVIGAFCRIRDKQLKQKLYDIRQVKRVSERDLENLGTVNDPTEWAAEVEKRVAMEKELLRQKAKES